MEKTILLKVISDDGYIIQAIRPCIGAKLQIGQNLEFDLGKITPKTEIFCEEVSSPKTYKRNVKD